MHFWASNREGGRQEAGKWPILVDDIVPATRTELRPSGTARMTLAEVAARSRTFEKYCGQVEKHSGLLSVK